MRYLKTHPLLKDPGWAANKCQFVVGELVEPEPGSGEALLSQSQRVWLIGHRHAVPLCPPMRPGQVEVEHRVVMTKGGCLIDLTPRQYDPNADLPTHYASLDDAGRDWHWATLQESSNEEL